MLQKLWNPHSAAALVRELSCALLFLPAALCFCSSFCLLCLFSTKRSLPKVIAAARSEQYFSRQGTQWESWTHTQNCPTAWQSCPVLSSNLRDRFWKPGRATILQCISGDWSMPLQLSIKLSCVILSLRGDPLTGPPCPWVSKGHRDEPLWRHLLYCTGGTAYVVEACLLWLDSGAQTTSVSV